MNVQIPLPISEFSNFIRLQRVTPWCLRLVSFAKHLTRERFSKTLTTSELQLATNTLVKISQRESFGNEIYLLSRKLPLPVKSRLLSLNPFLDKNGILPSSAFVFDI